MGCASSTEVQSDGSKKHKLGGAYPGNRRHHHDPYKPPASAFANGQAVAHFVSYGGGNALVLQENGSKPQKGGKAQFVQVTLPNGVVAGQKIHVQAPDGRLNEIIVPEGFGPGSSFVVEFVDEEAPPPGKMDNEVAIVPKPTAPPSAATASTSNNNHDDGFASGFNNPNFVPTAPAQASTIGNDTEIDLTAYPSASDAKPVYSSPPQYPPSNSRY